MKDEFSELVIDILKKGIKRHTYNFRAKVLALHFEITKSKYMDSLHFMDCNVNVDFLCQRLFNKFPSFQQKAKCNKCTYEKLILFSAINIQDLEMNSAYLDRSIREYFLEKSTCDVCSTQLSVVNSLADISKLKNGYSIMSKSNFYRFSTLISSDQLGTNFYTYFTEMITSTFKLKKKNIQIRVSSNKYECFKNLSKLL